MPKHGLVSMTFVDYWDKISLNSSWNVIKLAKGSLNNIFQDSFNKILSQQLLMTQDRSYIYLYVFVGFKNVKN